MNKNYEVSKCDEDINENKCFYFTLKQKINPKDSNQKDELEFFINSYGLIFYVIDDKHSVTLGLRDFMNSDEDFQRCIMQCYDVWREKRHALPKIDQ